MTFEEWWIDQHGQNWRAIFTHSAKDAAEESWNAATEAAREACAKVCLDEANKQWAAFEAEKTDYLEGRADSADYLWQKMRSNV